MTVSNVLCVPLLLPESFHFRVFFFLLKVTKVIARKAASAVEVIAQHFTTHRSSAGVSLYCFLIKQIEVMLDRLEHA